jgi:hypothetical protein
MTEDEFRKSIQDLLARPVDDLSAEDKAAVVRECIGKSSGSSGWLSPEQIGHLWMLGIPFLALLARLDWWLLAIIWLLAVSAFLLATLLATVDLREAGASQRITEDDFRSGVHYLLAQPVDDLSVKDKAEAIQACLVDMKQKERPPWWSRTMRSLPGYLLPFAGVATVAVLFPGIAWVWWLGLGIFFGLLVALLLCMVILGMKWLVKPVGQQPPSENAFGGQAVEPKVDA